MFADLFSLLFPTNCASCDSALLKTENVLCLSCQGKMPTTHFAKEENNIIEKIFWGRADVRFAMSLLYFNKEGMVQNIMHKLKYDGRKEIGFYLGNAIANALKESNRFSEINTVLPVPLHPKKLKSRGYNQSQFIADGVAQVFKIPAYESVLIRNTHTASQTKKSRDERWTNVSGKFTVTNSSLLENKHVLLVDDVITTGATIEACVNELNKIKNCTVSVASAAFAGSV